MLQTVIMKNWDIKGSKMKSNSARINTNKFVCFQIDRYCKFLSSSVCLYLNHPGNVNKKIANEGQLEYFVKPTKKYINI